MDEFCAQPPDDDDRTLALLLEEWARNGKYSWKRLRAKLCHRVIDQSHIAKMTEAERNAIKRLRTYLVENEANLDANKLGDLFFPDCWTSLRGNKKTGMTPDKLLRRIEEPVWDGRFLRFSIERHREYAKGAPHATVYRWCVDLDNCEAFPFGRLTGRPKYVRLAADLADAIINNRQDARIRDYEDGARELMVGEIMPGDERRYEARRRQLAQHVSEILAPHGWKLVGGKYCIFQRTEKQKPNF
jgi:hypothetical protein